MSKKRNFHPNGLQHLYQISADRSLIFCTLADKMLLFTLICQKASHYNLRITQICIMYNHFHIQASCSCIKQMVEFMDAVTWSFATIYNHHFGLKGQVFHRPFGSAPKVKPQKISGNMIYIANNPVVKLAVSDAWNYKWNFLRYSPTLVKSTDQIVFTPESKHPFSTEFDPLKASRDMLYMAKVARARYDDDKIIDYRFFESPHYASLTDDEKNQLTDLIISLYNVIDYQPILQKYGSMDTFCKVLKQVEGNEYDLNDDWESENYRHYDQMIDICASEGYDLMKNRYKGVETSDSIDKTVEESNSNRMPKELADKLIRRFGKEAGASSLEISKFLALKK